MSFGLSSFKDWSHERKEEKKKHQSNTNTGAVYNTEMHHTLLDQSTAMVGIFYMEACNSPTRTSYWCSRVGVFILLCASPGKS